MSQTATNGQTAAKSKTYAKRLGILRKREDMTHDQFVQHWMITHATLCKKLPGLRRYSVNLVAGLLENFMGVPDTPENRARFIGTIPLGRLSRPSDIASAALYLASNEAEFIIGVDLPVDGGRTV